MNRFLLFCAALVLPAAAWGQSDLPTVTVRAASEVAPELQVYQRVVQDAMQVVLDRDGFQVVADESAELVYSHRLVGFLPRLHVAVSVHDSRAGVHVAAVTVAARANVTLYSAVDDLLSDLNRDVQRYLLVRHDPEGRPDPVAMAGPVRLPGGDLQFRDRFSGQRWEDGLVLAEGAVVPVSVSSPGYYPQGVLLEITGPAPEVPDVSLRRRSRFALQGHYGYPRLLGAGVGGRYYPVADVAHLALELGLSLSGFFGATPSQVIHLDTRVLAGFAPAGRLGWLVQPVFSTGPGLAASFVTYGELPVPPYVDLYWNVLNAGVEVGRGALRVFARLGFSYFFSGDRSLMDEGVSERFAPEALSGVMWRW